MQQLSHPPLYQILRIYSRNLKAKLFSGFELELNIKWKGKRQKKPKNQENLRIIIILVSK